jgi:hypothetical protein
MSENKQNNYQEFEVLDVTEDGDTIEDDKNQHHHDSE